MSPAVTRRKTILIQVNSANNDLIKCLHPSQTLSSPLFKKLLSSSPANDQSFSTNTSTPPQPSTPSPPSNSNFSAFEEPIYKSQSISNDCFSETNIHPEEEEEISFTREDLQFVGIEDEGGIGHFAFNDLRDVSQNVVFFLLLIFLTNLWFLLP